MGRYHLIDVDEFATAIEKGQLKRRQQVHALRTLDKMIRMQTERTFIPPYLHKASMHPLEGKEKRGPASER